MAAAQSFTFVDPRGRRERAARRQNPDGSVGGWVARSATVHPTATIHVDAIVGPGSVVGAGEYVRRGEIVEMETAQIRDAEAT